MPAKLLYRDAQGQDAAVDIPEGNPIFLGRAADCAVRTDDAMVSRKNCKITYLGGKFFVEDLGSSNGTFLNEKRIQKQQLTHGDVIRCGSLQVRYVEVAGQPVTGGQGGGGPVVRPRTQEINVQAVQPQGGGGYADAGALAERDAQLQAATGELETAKKQLVDAQTELETLRSRAELNDTELKRLRSEAIQVREELAKLRRDAAADKEELQAVNRAAESLQRELKKAKEELLNLKRAADDSKEELAAKDRQLERGQEELHGQKRTTEELRAKLNELQKTKDEGWRELNNQLSQLDHLREVIKEQERILEERRVGLIALESAAKDLRGEKEKLLVELVNAKNQRDDAVEKASRAQAAIDALEEEQRRLQRAVGGGGGGGEEVSRMSSELREIKVELRRLENDKARAVDALKRAEEERDEAAGRTAKLEVERSQLLDDKAAAEAAHKKAEEARLRAEAMRKKLEDELSQKSAAAGGGGPASAEAERRAQEAEARAKKLEDELKRAQKAAASAAPAANGGGDTAALKSRAKEVYEGINEALSELRTTILTAKGLFGEIRDTVKDEDARSAIAEAIASSMAHAEDAKGLLRGLRELAQE